MPIFPDTSGNMRNKVRGPTPSLISISTAPSAGWGFRRLNPNYTGPLFRISTIANPTVGMDIPQAADGTPDNTGVAAFIGSSTGTIMTVYDQYGSNDAVQTSTSRLRYSLLDVYRGFYSASADSGNAGSLVIPTTLTGDGRATTTLDVAFATYGGSGNYAILGSTLTGAGSRQLQIGSGIDPRVTLANTAYNKVTGIACNNQLQVLVVQYGTSTDNVRVNGRSASATVSAGSAGTWSGGTLCGIPAGVFGGQFFARVVYPATLSNADVATLETSAMTLFNIRPAIIGQIILLGGDLTAGGRSDRNLHGYVSQAEMYLGRRLDTINAAYAAGGGVQLAAYANRTVWTNLKRSDLSRNFLMLPEPSLDLSSNVSVDFATLVALSFTGSITSGANTVTGASSTTGLSVNQRIVGTGIPTGAYITAISGTTVTLSANATATNTSVSLSAKANFTGGLTSGSATITNVSNFTNLANGQMITGVGIVKKATIVSFDSTAGTITMSNNATATNSSAAITPTDPSLITAMVTSYWSGASGARTAFSYLVSQGWSARDILAPTTIVRNWSSSNIVTFDQCEAVRLAYNATVLSDQSGYGYTLVDFASIPILQDYTTAYFYASSVPVSTNFQLGLSTAGNGYGYMAKLYSDTINTLLAS